MSADLPVPFSNETTSRDAAESMRESGRAATQVEQVLAFLRERGEAGATFYEIDTALRIGIRQTMARTRALVIAGYVVDSGVKRRSDAGYANTVWRARDGDPVPLEPGPQTHGRIAAAVRRERERYDALEQQLMTVLRGFASGQYLDLVALASALAAERSAMLRLIEVALAERWSRDRLRAAMARRGAPELPLEDPATLPSLAALVPPGVYEFRKSSAGVDSWCMSAEATDTHRRVASGNAPMLEILSFLAHRRRCDGAGETA